MCGIIGVFSKNVKNKEKKIIKKAEPVNEAVALSFEDQYKRGTEGFGVITVDKDGTVVINRATEEIKFMFDIYRTPSESMVVHHRNPTSSDNKISQTHPIVVKNATLLKHQYAIIHNGICSNAEVLKKEFEELGFKYTTETNDSGKDMVGYHTGKLGFNDSESYSIALALYIENMDVVCRAIGNSAFIALQMDVTGKIEKVFFGRNGGVLNLSQTRGKLHISSEGQGQEIPDECMFMFDYDDDKMTLVKRKFEVEKYKTEVKSTVHSFSSDEERDAKSGKENITALPGAKEADDKDYKTHDVIDDYKAAKELVKDYKILLGQCSTGYEVDKIWEDWSEDMENDIYAQFSNFKDSIEPGSDHVYGSRIKVDDVLESVRYLFIAIDLGAIETQLKYKSLDESQQKSLLGQSQSDSQILREMVGIREDGYDDDIGIIPC